MVHETFEKCYEANMMLNIVVSYAGYSSILHENQQSSYKNWYIIVCNDKNMSMSKVDKST
jgi:UDP-N-acetylglucosamine transferase subunit ALG13